MRLFSRISKLILLASVMITLVGCGMNPVVVNPPLSPNKDWPVAISWNYDFTNYTKCSGTVTKGCISGFTWGFMQSGNKVPIKTSAVTVCTGSTQPTSCADTANSLLGIGPITYYLTVNGIDNNGAASTSDANSAPSTIPLISATNVAVSLGP